MRRVLVVAVLIAAFFVAAVPILSSAQGTTPGSVNPNTVKSYQLQLDKANAAAAAAEQNRIQAGGRVGSTSDPNYQQTVAALGIAQANAQIAQLQLQQSQQGSSLLSATAQI